MRQKILITTVAGRGNQMKESKESGNIIRLQKVISQAGIASRREAERLILEGRVLVNGIVVSELGAKADQRTDDIRVDGKKIRESGQKVYVLLNKPKRSEERRVGKEC